MDPLAAISTFGSIVAPMALVVTGMLYAAGWSRNRAFLLEMGLDVRVLDESLQSTLARGLIPLAMGVVAVAALGAVFIWLDRHIGGGKIHWGPLKGARTDTLSILAFFFVTVAYIAGTIYGGAEAGALIARVDDGCHRDCFAYRVKRMNIVGFAVLQDKERTAVYTKGGLLILKTDDLHLVRRCRRKAC